MAKNVVHQLIKDENFEEIEGLLKSPKGPELARRKDDEGNLPLHHIAAIAYPIGSLFWSTIDLLLQIHPEGLKEKNQNGKLPLHIVTKRWLKGPYRRGAHRDILMKFLRKHPEGVNKHDKGMNEHDKGLLLTEHFFQVNIRVATNFLLIYPEGAGVKDGEGLSPIEHAFQGNRFACDKSNRFDLVQLIAKYYPKCLALQVCHCPLAKIHSCTDCNDKHPLMTFVREFGKSSNNFSPEKISEEISNILRLLNLSLSGTHHPVDVHKILQLEDSLASEKQRVTDLKLRVGDFEKKSNDNNERLESQKERNHNLKTTYTTLQAQFTEMQQHLDSEKQRNQTRKTENATLQGQITEIHQQLDDNERKTRKQIDGLLSLLVEFGAQVIESCSDVPIPNLKHLIKILCRRLDTLLLSDGGDDRKPSFAQSVGTYLAEDDNASKDMLMECIQTLFSECVQAEGGDHQDAAGQCATTARAQTSGAARRKRDDNSSDHRYSQDDDAVGSTPNNKRARVYVSPEQEQS
jgi:predicted transcriptional regulator